MLSKSIIAASLLVALAPTTVLGAPVPEAVEVEAREPMIMPAVPRIPTINNIIRRPVGRVSRLYATRELDLEEREPMIMPLTPFIRPTTLSNIRRRPIGGGLLKTREVEEKLSARRLAHHAHLGHSSVDMGLHPAIRTRDLSDQDLEARLIFKGIRPLNRPIGFKGITREFDDETLEARQPIFRIIKKIGKGLLGRDLEELDAREWEELEARQPIFGIIKKIGKGIFGRELHELDAREWEELEARQPIFGIIKKISKGIFGRELHELDAREWDELEARQPIFGIIKKIGKGIFGRDLEGLDAREWEELEARQPIFGIIKKIGKGIFGRELEDLNARQWEEVLERAVEHHQHHHHTRGLELDQLD